MTSNKGNHKMKRHLAWCACLLLSLACEVFGQTRTKSHRDSFGDVRATIMETLLLSVYHGAQFRWAPDLELQLPKESFNPAHFPGFTFNVAPDGSLYGASGFELGSEKEQAIFESKQFRRKPAREFGAALLVFRADAKGNVTRAERFDLDPSDPMPEIKMVHAASWPGIGWPVLQVRYVSHAVAQGSYTRIEWQASFDANAGKLISRLPAGIVTQTGSNESMQMFSIQRTDANHLQITDTLSKKVKPYSCSDPCIVDGPTLLAQWSQ